MAEPNGLYYMRARYYDPGVGRFISEDPLGFGGGDVNLFAYVRNDPVSRIDAWGLMDCPGMDFFIGGSGNPLCGGGGGGLGGGGTSGSPPMENTPTVQISRGKFPETSQHILDAQGAGYPSRLTIDRAGARANRAAATKDCPNVSGKHLDEYPPAMFKEGGSGASVRPIDPADNMGAGASMGNQLRNYLDGTEIIIMVVP